jgi:hypothetical protein
MMPSWQARRQSVGYHPVLAKSGVDGAGRRGLDRLSVLQFPPAASRQQQSAWIASETPPQWDSAHVA